MFSNSQTKHSLSFTFYLFLTRSEGEFPRTGAPIIIDN
ncbi:hypothetical protein BTH41_02682 [Bacillus mycoides]|nr:hypothetical protein BTH41_02682 [Bacillus mycoides]